MKCVKPSFQLNKTITDYNPFVKLIPEIVEPLSHYEITENLFTPKDLIKSENLQILNYNGSLTTPGCYETVIWMVSTTPLSISSDDLAEFRKIKNEKGQFIVENARPYQKFGFRSLRLFY